MKICSFPPLEPGMEMDAVLAPPRNQLGHLGNHWNSLHFRRPARWGAVRAKGTLDASEKILWLLGNHQKPLATVTFHTKSRIPYLGNVFALVRLCFELRTMHTETLQKP